MNIASCLKMFALGICASMLLMPFTLDAATYTYLPMVVKASLHTSHGRQEDIEFQSCSKLEAAENIDDDYVGTAAIADIFNIPDGATAIGCKADLTSFTTGTNPEQINASATQLELMSLVSINNYGEAQGIGTSSGGKRVWSVFATTTMTINGIPIPSGSHPFGEEFSVAGPVPILHGSSNTSLFTGKMVLGEMHALRDGWGNVIGTRFVVIHICGTLTDSDGNRYDIDQNIGQNDVKGVMPNQVTIVYTFIQG